MARVAFMIIIAVCTAMHRMRSGFSVAASSVSPRWAWGRSYLDDGFNVAAPQSSGLRETAGVATGLEQVYSTGSFHGPLHFPGGHRLSSNGKADAVVVAVDALTGALAWAKAFGGPGNDKGRGVAYGNNSVFVAGGFHGTVRSDVPFWHTADGSTQCTPH